MQMAACHILAMPTAANGALRHGKAAGKGRRSVGFAFSDDELALLQAFVAERASNGTFLSGIESSANARKQSLTARVEPDSEIRALRRCFSEGWFSPPAFVRVAALAGMSCDELLRRVRSVHGERSSPAAESDLGGKIAYLAWVQLTHRIIATDISWKHDDLIRVYDSWHEAFVQLRGIVSDAPVWRTDARTKSRVVCELIGEVLTEMRTHLTHWQSRYRKWHERENAKGRLHAKSPAQVLEDYPEREELMQNFETAQRRLKVLAGRLKTYAFTPRGRLKPTEAALNGHSLTTQEAHE